MKKGIHKKPSDFFWLMLFFSIILTILSGVTSCFLVSAPGIKCDLVTSDFGIKKRISVVGSLPTSQQCSLACNQKKTVLAVPATALSFDLLIINILFDKGAIRELVYSYL